MGNLCFRLGNRFRGIKRFCKNTMINLGKKTRTSKQRNWTSTFWNVPSPIQRWKRTKLHDFPSPLRSKEFLPDIQRTTNRQRICRPSIHPKKEIPRQTSPHRRTKMGQNGKRSNPSDQEQTIFRKFKRIPRKSTISWYQLW